MTTATITKSVHLTIPVDLINDARIAAYQELAKDVQAHAAELSTEFTANAEGTAKILGRAAVIASKLETAHGEITLTAPADRTSNPLLHLLEKMISTYTAAIAEEARFAPIDAAAIGDLADRLAWAADAAVALSEDD